MARAVTLGEPLFVTAQEHEALKVLVPPSAQALDRTPISGLPIVIDEEGAARQACTCGPVVYFGSALDDTVPMDVPCPVHKPGDNPMDETSTRPSHG